MTIPKPYCLVLGRRHTLADRGKSQRCRRGRSGRTPWADLRGRPWQLADPTQNIIFVRSGDDLVDGLFVELDAWRWQMFRIDPLTFDLNEGAVEG